MDYPQVVNYREIPEGKRKLIPRGKILSCTKCGQNGLRQVYAWRHLGRCTVSYHHQAVRQAQGEVPVVSHSCEWHNTPYKELPALERSRGR